MCRTSWLRCWRKEAVCGVLSGDLRVSQLLLANDQRVIGKEQEGRKEGTTTNKTKQQNKTDSEEEEKK